MINEINSLKNENNTLKNKLKEEEQKFNENKLKNDFIQNFAKNNTKAIINNRQLNDKIDYDIIIKIETLKALLNGWEIKYGKEGKQNYLNKKDKKILLIGLLGLKNSGKTFILSRLFNEKISKKEESDNLYLKYIKLKNCELAVIDTPGIGRILKEGENKSLLNQKYINELEKYNIQTDNFLINFILKKSNFVICVVGYLNFNEQKLLSKLKAKDEEYKKEFKQLKKLFIIHNLKDFSTKEEVFQYINNVLLKSITFQLIENETQIAQTTMNINNNTKYFIEKNIDKEMEIYHLIIAKEDSEAGKYFNESTYTLITQHYNSFHFFNTFDLIKEIKEEIKLNSKNIFNKPILSLDDFENIENKIKIKNNFELLNSDKNVDFSYLSLKPKYSYYKINNNSQLLVVIEMPGKIIDPKFICHKKPKNGYYIMTFSGKKVVDLPDNSEDAKKKGFFYSNIEDGDFEETIKISMEKFQIKSHKFKNEEDGKGIYKFIFDLIEDDSNSEEF